MIKQEAILQAKEAYRIESECLEKMLDFFDETAFAKAVELLKNAERIGASGCGHSGIKMCIRDSSFSIHIYQEPIIPFGT